MDVGCWNAAQHSQPKGATHCDNCGCTWLDDGLNPIGCPYCKNEAQAKDVERWSFLKFRGIPQNIDYVSDVFSVMHNDKLVQPHELDKVIDAAIAKQKGEE